MSTCWIWASSAEAVRESRNDNAPNIGRQQAEAIRRNTDTTTGVAEASRVKGADTEAVSVDAKATCEGEAGAASSELLEESFDCCVVLVAATAAPPLPPPHFSFVFAREARLLTTVTMHSMLRVTTYDSSYMLPAAEEPPLPPLLAVEPPLPLLLPTTPDSTAEAPDPAPAAALPPPPPPPPTTRSWSRLSKSNPRLPLELYRRQDNVFGSPAAAPEREAMGEENENTPPLEDEEEVDPGVGVVGTVTLTEGVGVAEVNSAELLEEKPWLPTASCRLP